MENQPNGCHILTHVHVSVLYIRYHCLLSDLVWHGSTVLSSNTVNYLKFLVKVTNSYAAQLCDFNG